VATNAVRTTVSTGAGDYYFYAVPPGVYTIQVTHSGFQTAKTQNVQLSVQQSLAQNFTLNVGAQTQSVTVSSTGALLQVDDASLGTVIENQAITQLPLNGRNYLSLVALSSNVNTLSPTAGQAGSRQGGDRAGQSIAVGGQRIMYDHYTLDGVDNTDPDFNTYIVLPSDDAIQEFKVQTGVYPAQFGYEASQVNVVTKSGTNHYHGALFEYIRNNAVDAQPYNFKPVPVKVTPFKWNDYGFVLGGPITVPKVFNGTNRFFFLVNEEWFKQRASGQASATLPTQDELNGDFSQMVDKNGNQIPIYDPSTYNSTTGLKTQFQGNKLTSIDPISAKVMQLFYHPASLPIASQNYFYGTSSKFDRQAFTLRADYNQSSKSQWSFRWSYGNEPNSSLGFPAAGGTTGSKTVTNYYQYMGSNTWTITPTFVNQIRFGYTNFVNSLGTLSQGTNDEVGKIGIPGLSSGEPSTWGIPDFSFADNFTGIGDTNDGPYVTSDPNWEIVDNASWVKGKHALDFGFDFTRMTFNELGNQFSRGVFNFQNYATANFINGKAVGGDGLADFLLGDLYQTTYAVQIADANYVRNVEAAYIDDTYKITPKLTIALGLRYELTPPWTDTLGNEFIVNLNHSPLYPSPQQPQSAWPYFVRQGHCSDPYAGINVRWVESDGKTPVTPAPVCSNGQLPNQLMQTAFNNWAPRLSISYSPTAKLVIRTGFGMFYNHDIANARFDMARNLAGRVTVIAGQNGEVPQGVPDLTWSNAVGGGGAVATIKPPYAYSMQYDHKTSYTEVFLLDVQRQVGQNWSFEAGYLGSVSRHLFGFRNANQTIPYGYIGNGANTSIASRTPYPNYGVIQLVHDIGVGDYHSLSVKATRRYSNGFNLIGSYTFSKSLDDTSGIRTQQSQLFPQDSDCVPCDYGPSDFDVAHRVTTSVFYELPIGKGKLWAPGPVLDTIIGGWQLGTIATMQSGPAESINVGFNNSNTNNAYDRPNLTGAPIYAAHKSRFQWINPDAFANAPAGTYGNERRNSVRGPGVVNFDAAIHKDFHMPFNEKHLLQFRFEAFNVANHPNFGLPINNMRNSTLFGQILGAQSMRELQLAARYTF
jgi:hypothetical protein